MTHAPIYQAAILATGTHLAKISSLSPTDKSQGSNSSSLSTRINRQEEITDLGKKNTTIQRNRTILTDRASEVGVQTEETARKFSTFLEDIRF